MPEIDLQEVEVMDTTISKADNVLISLVGMKEEIINSIYNGSCLSKMQPILMEQINLPFREFADWKNLTFPNAKILPDHLSHLNVEISEMLISWYKEAKGVDVPFYLFTDEERDKATFWDEKANEFVTKVLYHVVIDLLLQEQEAGPIDCTNSNLEDLCVNWGGRSNTISLQNTCTVDNLITMISINIIQIKDAIAKNGIHLNADIIKFLDLIESKNFNSTKCWLAERVNLQKEKGTCFNFYGSEQRFVHHINSLLGYGSYQLEIQCWSCCFNTQKYLNLTTINSFVTNCQNTLDYQIRSNIHKCRKCREESEIEILAQNFSNVPILFMMEMNPLKLDNADISRTILLQHEDRIVEFSLLGYSVYSATGEGHFFSYLLIGEQWYMYDGIRRPKLCKQNQPLIRSKETISTIMYLIK